MLEWREKNDWADKLAGKAAFSNGLLLRRSEVLRSLRHYLWAQSQGHHTIDHLEERGMERGSAQWSSPKVRERAIFSQTNVGTVSKATLGKLMRDGVEHIWAFLSAYIYTTLNWTVNVFHGWINDCCLLTSWIAFLYYILMAVKKPWQRLEGGREVIMFTWQRRGQWCQCPVGVFLFRSSLVTLGPVPVQMLKQPSPRTWLQSPDRNLHAYSYTPSFLHSSFPSQNTARERERRRSFRVIAMQ